MTALHNFMASLRRGASFGWAGLRPKAARRARRLRSREELAALDGRLSASWNADEKMRHSADALLLRRCAIT
jgi:hypothetical protein